MCPVDLDHDEFLPAPVDCPKLVWDPFGRVKQWLRTHAKLVKNMDPYDAIDASFDAITQTSCKNWVLHMPFYH